MYLLIIQESIAGNTTNGYRTCKTYLVLKLTYSISHKIKSSNQHWHDLWPYAH